MLLSEGCPLAIVDCSSGRLFGIYGGPAFGICGFSSHKQEVLEDGTIGLNDDLTCLEHWSAMFRVRGV